MFNEDESLVEYGFRPDYDSGPHLLLMTAMVRLARQDMSNPSNSAECQSQEDEDDGCRESAKAFLSGSLVSLFADCLGYEGSFLDARND